MTSPPSQHAAGPVYFLLACILYLVAATFLGTQGIVNLSIVSLTLAFLLGLLNGDSGRMSTVGPLFLAMLFVAAFNVLVSADSRESALRWLLWMEMFIAFGLLATRCDGPVEKLLARLLPFGAAMIWFAKYYASGDPELTLKEKESDLHLSAFFASVTIASGMFHPRIALRIGFLAIGIYGVLVSGSRAAFLFLPITFIAPALYYVRSRTSALSAVFGGCALLAGLFFGSETFRDATFGRKAFVVGRDAIEDARNSFEDRGVLRDVAAEMILAKPLGYGYGNTYTIPGLAGKDRGTNFHSGYLNVGAAMGLPFLIAYVLFNLWLFKALLFEPYASRFFRHLFLSILICANLRAMTEDFTLFDLGNPICYLVVYMTLLYLNKRRFEPIGLST